MKLAGEADPPAFTPSFDASQTCGLFMILSLNLQGYESLARKMAEGLDIRLSSEVTEVQHSQDPEGLCK